MKLTKLFILLSLLAMPFLFSACMTTERAGKKHTIVLGGLYEHREGSYMPVSKNTFPVSRAEFDPGAPYSGNNTTFLWGLFTYHDY